MRVIFRVDASLEIGTGHVMRCLTLAETLREHGVDCHFICRNHPGNLIKHIGQHRFDVDVLPYDRCWTPRDTMRPVHAAWLGEDWEIDAEQTKVCVGERMADWLVVDHYALDARWENKLASHYRQLMVVDDLADRPHACDLLLDQTFNRDVTDYFPLVPADCLVLCGSQYALLRPEFARFRSYSLRRRSRPVCRNLLITMGGVDKNNATGQMLQILNTCSLPADCRINVVMGGASPWLYNVREMAQSMPWSTQVLVGVKDMAQLMADSDLAIGAGGVTTWERCCLGLPTVMVVIADNQRHAARLLEEVDAVRILDMATLSHEGAAEFIRDMADNQSQLVQLSQASSQITDGLGCERIVAKLMS